MTSSMEPADIPFEQRPHRPCVGALVFDPQGRALIGKRSEGPEHVAPGFAWQLPQGGIDEGEEPEPAARRELYEETNIRSVRLLREAADWFAYDLPEPVAREAWGGRYRGQTQKWFAYRFEGEESEIDVLKPGGCAHEPEFAAWRWEKLEALPSLVIPFKRGVYERIVEEFSDLV